MRWMVLVLLAGCGQGLSGSWAGTCDLAASIGEIELLTGDLGESAQPREDVAGEHDLYLVTQAELTLPAGDVQQVGVELVHCRGKDGCVWDDVRMERNEGLMVVLDDQERLLMHGWGPLKGKSIQGTCLHDQFTGEGDLVLERTRKGLENQ